jgi:hypothetical protein
MLFSHQLIRHGARALLLLSTLAIGIPAQSGNAGAFIGGMLTSRVLGNMNERTQAEQQQAYYAQQGAQQTQVPQAAPASTPTQTTEQKLDELNKLAAGGYITPEEYKAKKQQILNSL